MTNEGKIKCSFEQCFEYFPNPRQMIKHKKYDHADQYCKVCDLDSPDWYTGVAHKAQMSGLDKYRKTQKQYAKEKEQGVFWNNKEKYGPDYGNLKFHMYTCKFCGQSWNTESARQKHTLMQHPLDQKIKCPGCDETFPKAAGLLYHLEEGYCNRITASEFRGYLQHKGLVIRLLQDPTVLTELSEKDINSYYESARDEDTTGGVSLLDIKDEDIIWDDEQIIVAEKPRVTPTIPPHQQSWPVLAPQARNAGSAMPVHLVNAHLTNAFGSMALDTQKTSQWGANNANKALFPAAKATPATDEWQVRQQALDQEGKRSNILTFQFWNPASPDYEPDRFYDPIIEKHRCPFPTCDKYFDLPVDCQRHISTEHAITQIRCPCCLKLFKAHYALIAHVESSDKCNIRNSSKFGQALDEFSGGFLSHEIVPHPDLKAEEDGYQVAMHKYDATVPASFREKVKGTTIGTIV